jgi:predicted alpha/beta-fold hydrolase
MPFTFTDYVAPAALRNGHRMTIFVWARPRRFPRLPEPVDRVFDVAPRTRVLARCHWQPSPASAPTLLLLHGLEGSADGHYMRGIAEKAWVRGFNAVRLNQRNCGGTDHLSEGVYHSGLVSDPMTVVRELIERDRLPAIGIIGYSLGGNLALRMAGDYGSQAPPEVKAFAAVSPTLDLAVCIEALERKINRVYQWNFMRGLRDRMKRKARLFPQLYSTAALRRVRTLREFDDAYTAPLSGFRDAADYYYRASSMRVIERVRVPTLVIAAGDDPFIPVDQFRDPAVAGNPHVTVIITRHGGHCGFIEARNGQGGDGYWAERTVMAFAAAYVRFGDLAI